MKKILLMFLLIFVLFPLKCLAAEKVEINTASLQELDKITGIGPALGQRIIDARPFSSVDDLLRVKGIGEITLQKIKDQGLACVNCSTVIPSSTGNPESTAQTLDSRLRGNDTDNTPAITYPTGVFINEILPTPKEPMKQKNGLNHITQIILKLICLVGKLKMRQELRHHF